MDTQVRNNAKDSFDYCDFNSLSKHDVTLTHNQYTHAALPMLHTSSLHVKCLLLLLHILERKCRHMMVWFSFVKSLD